MMREARPVPGLPFVLEGKQMSDLPYNSPQPARILSVHRLLTAAICAVLAVLGGNAWAQLAPNQTNGFGNGRLITFTYLQSFDCVDQPLLDLDFNSIKAESDPNEMQTPICQAGP